MNPPKSKLTESLKQWFLSDIKHPLLAAARDGDLPKVIERLKAGDDVNWVDTCVTALSLSIVFDRKDVFDHLLNVDNIDVNSIDLGIDSGQVELFPNITSPHRSYWATFTLYQIDFKFHSFQCMQCTHSRFV